MTYFKRHKRMFYYTPQSCWRKGKTLPFFSLGCYLSWRRAELGQLRGFSAKFPKTLVRKAGVSAGTKQAFSPTISGLQGTSESRLAHPPGSRKMTTDSIQGDGSASKPQVTVTTAWRRWWRFAWVAPEISISSTPAARPARCGSNTDQTASPCYWWGDGFYHDYSYRAHPSLGG